MCLAGFVDRNFSCTASLVRSPVGAPIVRVIRSVAGQIVWRGVESVIQRDRVDDRRRTRRQGDGNDGAVDRIQFEDQVRSISTDRQWSPTRITLSASVSTPTVRSTRTMSPMSGGSRRSRLVSTSIH